MRTKLVILVAWNRRRRNSRQVLRTLFGCYLKPNGSIGFKEYLSITQEYKEDRSDDKSTILMKVKP